MSPSKQDPPVAASNGVCSMRAYCWGLLFWMPIQALLTSFIFTSGRSPVLGSESPSSTEIPRAKTPTPTRGPSPVPEAEEGESGLIKKLEANAQAKIAERWAFLSSSVAYEAANYKKLSLASHVAVSLLVEPHYPCLWTLDKYPSARQRHEGGKWTCGLPEMASRAPGGPEECVVYSVGSDGNDEFEKRVRSLTQQACQIHIFDPTVSGRGLERMKGWGSSFHTVGLGTVDGVVSLRTGGRRDGMSFPVQTLATTMAKLHHSYIDVLKIDCEGCEWDLFTTLPWETLRIGQLLIEIHDQQGAKKLPQLLEVFDRLHKAGFYIFSAEPVNSVAVGQYEISLLHRDWQPMAPPPVKHAL
ncbi:Mettl24 [Symbiodinium natans]|uniref:Mettl24 protein n=1 Tax=Symbiodinium natans TaxID=878477 RepID=A0A812NN51_9DINO|nr:Mettl24 [Symbiodinium natans]